jgi:cytoskeletal protein CcmA (bactofilin family)
MIWKKSEAEEPAAPSLSPTHTSPPPAARGSSQTTKERAVIGTSIEIKGTLTGGEDLLIEGRIEGEIEVRQHAVTVGKNGRIKADIHGRTIIVQGEVDGNLYAEEQIILRNTSTVRGNILGPRVTLEDGAHFKGSLDMTAKSAPETPPPPPGVRSSPATSPQTPRPATPLTKS